MKRKRIALRVDPVGAYGRHVIAGIAAFAHHRPEWQLFIRGLHGGSELADETGQPMDAAVLQDIGTRTLARVLEAGLPMVRAGSVKVDAPMPTVMADNQAIGRLAAGHLLERGLRQLVYYAQGSHGASLMRERGFRQAVEGAGARFWRFDAPADRWQAQAEQPQQSLAQWLVSLPRPVGVFAFNDIRAVAVVRAAQTAGLAVPDDVAVLGVDDDPLVAAQVPMGLSSSPPNAWRIGRRAAALLDGMLGGRQVPPDHLELIPPPDAVARTSTGTMAVSDEMVALILRRIQQRFADPQLLIDPLIEDQPISRRAFERRFHEAVGRSPGEHIRHLRLRRARELLANPRMPLEEVAKLSGFSGARHMGVAFRRQLGTAPMAYRRQCLECV